MSPHPGNPGNMTHPIINVLGCALVALVLLSAACLVLSSCATNQCPACAPIVVCEPWIEPLGSASPGAGGDAGVDAAPAPSGSVGP